MKFNLKNHLCLLTFRYNLYSPQQLACSSSHASDDPWQLSSSFLGCVGFIVVSRNKSPTAILASLKLSPVRDLLLCRCGQPQCLLPQLTVDPAEVGNTSHLRYKAPKHPRPGRLYSIVILYIWPQCSKSCFWDRPFKNILPPKLDRTSPDCQKVTLKTESIF